MNNHMKSLVTEFREESKKQLGSNWSSIASLRIINKLGGVKESAPPSALKIPTIFYTKEAAKIWLSAIKRKYKDDWKNVVNAALYSDVALKNTVHPEITKHLNRKQP